MQISLH